MNPIENVWSILEREVDQHHITNLAEFKEAITIETQKLDRATIQRCIRTMPDRLNAVIQKNGEHIPY